jgi:hypothetical protein
MKDPLPRIFKTMGMLFYPLSYRSPLVTNVVRKRCPSCLIWGSLTWLYERHLMQENKNNKMKTQKAFCNYVKVFCYLLLCTMLSNIEMFQEFLEKHEIKIKDLSTVLRENMGDDQFSNFIKRKGFQKKIV